MSSAMEWSPYILLISLSVSTALEWTNSSLPHHAKLRACVKTDVNLAWNYTLGPDQRLHEVTWYCQRDGKQKEALATMSLEQFMVVHDEVKHVSFLPDAGLTLHDVTSEDSGEYTVEVSYNEANCINSDSHTVNLLVSDTCSIMIHMDEQFTQLQSQVEQQMEGVQDQFASVLDQLALQNHTNDQQTASLTSTEDSMNSMSGRMSGLDSRLTQLESLFEQHMGSVQDQLAALSSQLALADQTVRQLSQQVATLTPIGSDDACQLKGGEEFRNVCYIYIHEEKTWAAARQACWSKGGHLAEVHTEAVNTFLKSMVHAAGYTGRDKNIWLGMSDTAEEGSFVWDSSHQPPSFTDWEEGEPNNLRNEEHCVQHVFGKTEQWNDESCTTKTRFICQLSMDG